MRWWHSNNLLRHPLFVPVLLVVTILVVYYPALLSGVHPIDDPGIFALYSASPPLTNILLPGAGYYYRPVVELSYYLDNLLWGMEPGTMHLENILLHCANSTLVYFLARIISCDTESPVIPFLSSLLFALHPVNVEAVTWIAGRTDPLLTLFILSACYFWLKWFEKPGWQYMAASLLMFAVALLTKETALAFGAVALLLAKVWPGKATNRQRLQAVGIIILPCVLLVIFVLIFWSGSGALSRFVSGSELQVAKDAWSALIAFGFYFSKFIIPFPLSFAITEVHPLYGLLGVALLPFFWWAFRRNRLSGVCLISAALLILPATLLALKQVAWTPFAERYMYLPSAFFALSVVGFCQIWQRKYPVILMNSFAVVLCGCALSGFQRNLLWKAPLAFFQDAVAKSPKFGSLYHSMGALYMQKGEIDRAIEAFTIAERLNKRESMRYLIKLSILGTKVAKGDFVGAGDYFRQLFRSKMDAPAEFLELLYAADAKKLKTVEDDLKVESAKDLLETLELLYLKKPDPFWLYRSGQIALVAGDKSMAGGFFRKAYAEAPADAHYKGAARTYYLRLEGEK